MYSSHQTWVESCYSYQSVTRFSFVQTAGSHFKTYANLNLSVPKTQQQVRNVKQIITLQTAPVKLPC